MKRISLVLMWLISLLVFWALSLHAQVSSQDTPKPSMWWVHAGVVAHFMCAAEDGLSSWKQGEANSLYSQKSGPYAGDFYTTGARRMAEITIGVVAVSYAVAYIHPGWRKYIGIVNLSAAAAHQGVVVSNVVRNPYYR